MTAVVEHIEALYCWIVVTETGNEGVMTINYEDGQKRPAIGPDIDTVQQLRPLAEEALAAGYSVRLARFGRREDLEVLEPQRSVAH